jgi:hypothetical protein
VVIGIWLIKWIVQGCLTSVPYLTFVFPFGFFICFQFGLSFSCVVLFPSLDIYYVYYYAKHSSFRPLTLFPISFLPSVIYQEALDLPLVLYAGSSSSIRF